jgi:tetratricopeptide (TPR) repeat protein
MLALLHGVTEVRLVDPATGRLFARLPAAGCPYCFNPDGSQLVTHAGRGGAIQVWDLRAIRQHLKEMDLDWDLPPYPAPTSESAKPLRVQVLAAESLPPSRELDARAYLERGLLNVQVRRYRKAAADLCRAAKLDPRQLPWREAVGAYSQAIERYPQDGEAYHQRAHMHERLGQWDSAVADHSQAIQRTPQCLYLYACRARAYLRMGKMHQAAEDFRKAGPLRPKEANDLAWGLAASPVSAHPQPTLAVELAKQAVQQAPGVALYWNTLGLAHYRAGNWEAAVRALVEAQKLAPGESCCFNAMVLAMCHHQLGGAAKARDHYDRAVRGFQQTLGELSATHRQELEGFRAEAEALLKGPTRRP